MDIIHVKTAEQLQACRAIRREVFVQEQNVPEELEQDEYDRSPSAASHFLIVHEGLPVGTARWSRYMDDQAKLQRVAVRAEFRGRGWGKELLLAMEDHAREHGCTDAVLGAQCQVEGFYRRLGYATVSEPYEEAGMLHVNMQKRL